MEIGLTRLMDEKLDAYIEESRRCNAASQPVAGPTTVEELRQLRERRASVTPSRTRAVERTAEVGDRRVPVRITAPQDADIRGAYLDIHAGGFYLGSAADEDVRNARLADALGVAVVSVEYRLAPEHPWPAAPDDCETAALWLLEQAESLFGATELAIGGASAGATLVMTTLRRLRDQGLADRFDGAVLQFGAYDLSGRSPGGRLYADEFFITAYAGHVADRTDPDISPLYGDLADLPPTLLLVGDLDIVLEDNLAMAARLAAAGNDVDIRVYPESAHAFTFRPTGMAAAALRDAESWLARRLFGK
ncbi:alpha/beta hydrolase [Nocardia sp. CDC159]|uniref:Alpha/beta hydrolase n=1 Tax=Nocardia pulmonis TaxID=2951408 RepID=A0A9X2J0X6_9NOCA|nr:MULTISPECIES: alpha/beta hydrolase [Nocardia]MCM6779033.1 alpha/beta hydrolase [Nocardia pulmonis]MCM6791923.1 alpha/beta hydrolase [Nocardia sp. CDC159]